MSGVVTQMIPPSIAQLLWETWKAGCADTCTDPMNPPFTAQPLWETWRLDLLTAVVIQMIPPSTAQLVWEAWTAADGCHGLDDSLVLRRPGRWIW